MYHSPMCYHLFGAQHWYLCGVPKIDTPYFLADRTAARSMIGYWHDTVVCLSATKCTVALRVVVVG